MAEIRPFRGIRYNQEAIGDLSLVVAPIYDVIDNAARDAYYNKHPYNVIRLILNRPKANDKNSEQPYIRAAEFMDRWLMQRILIQDPVPGIYLYRERYLLESEYKECTGIIARVRVVDFSEGVILPHEDIMPKPFEDRMKLLAHTRANLSTVYTLYSDPAEKLKEPILAEMDRFPLAQFQTADGVAHDLWGITEEKFVKKVVKFFQGRNLYIADGHHRYQTAFEYSRRLRESGEITDEDDPRNFLMIMIVEMENPGLSVLPVHRAIMKPDIDIDRALHEFERWFTIAKVEVPKGARSGQVFHLLKQLGEAGQSGHVYGMFLKDGRFLLLSQKAGSNAEKDISGDFSQGLKRLDVTVLHKVLIEKALGIPPGRESVEQNIKFLKDPMEAVDMVASGAASLAFFMNATPVEQVKQVADHAEKMPQKSTYFYPKPFSGVLINRVTEW
jgi:uncharacterized protein (DUF1015 family)